MTKPKQIKLADYNLSFSEAKSAANKANTVYGIYVTQPDGTLLYFNNLPLELIIKDYAAKPVLRQAAYNQIDSVDGKILASGQIKTSAGSVFEIKDLFFCDDNQALGFTRSVTVLHGSADDLGFASRIRLLMAGQAGIASQTGITVENGREKYDCFAPGAWYLQNQDTPAHWFGHDQTRPVSWLKETRLGLPFFAVRHQYSGQAISFARRKADIKLSQAFEWTFDSLTNPDYDYGALGCGREQDFSIDYVFPGSEGDNPEISPYRNQPYRYQFGYRRRYHPVTTNFTQKFSLIWRFSCEPDYLAMLRETWRYYYQRFREEPVGPDNEQIYHTSMQLFDTLCRDYHGSWGVPFKCLLPGGEIGIVDYQFGFIGQQANIGYQLIRYGDFTGRTDIAAKGKAVIDYWVSQPLTDWGAPRTWLDVNPAGPLDQPVWLRMIGDGMEGILDSYRYLSKKGEEKEAWLDYCIKVADWLLRAADDQGCWCRAYGADGTVQDEARTSTTHVIRFLVQLCLVTKDDRYRQAALKAGAWSYQQVYQNMKYLGATCDNNAVLDNESGIYALFAFLALYDLTADQKWLEAAKGAADYTETWTYCWSFPVRPIEKKHAFHHVPISGQSLIAAGHSGADIYMAACSYVYYRLYLHTGDRHYKDMAAFFHKNPKRATDLDGHYGYGRPGLCEEGGELCHFDSRGVYAWLPWCSYVQVDPVFRLYETFGVFEIDQADKLPREWLTEKNKIYNYY